MVSCLLYKPLVYRGDSLSLIFSVKISKVHVDFWFPPIPCPPVLVKYTQILKLTSMCYQRDVLCTIDVSVTCSYR